MSQPLSAEAAKLLAVRGDFEVYSEHCLSILTKDGKLEAFRINPAQQYLHERIEEQRLRLGYVRIIVLKGRQQGVSTYVGGRYYWKTSGEFGKRTYILTHLAEATANLFNMVKRYHDNMPLAMRPKVKSDNEKELSFTILDSKYSVATAGSRGTGRSGTAQYFHGSEVAFWPSAPAHMAGIGQVIPLAEGTEIILESTANGIGNHFHTMVMKALAGKGDYELVFIPWFWQAEYKRTPPDDFVLESDEIEYMEAFDLTLEQMAWRRFKIEDEFGGDTSLFDQEYPATVEMAFMAGASKALISPLRSALAVKNNLKDNSPEALILGVDPAEYGDDDTAAVLRRGRKVLRVWRWSKEGNAQIAGRIGRILDKLELDGDPVDAVCIDVTGVGTGVEAFLTEQGYSNIYRVHNGNKATEDEKYRNRGAECWGLMADWFKDDTRPVDIPAKATVNGVTKEDKLLQAEVSSRGYTYDSRRRLVLQSKEEMQKLGIPSPNTADALALTFAVSVKAKGRKRTGETLQEKLLRLAANSNGRGGSPGMAA